MRLFSRWYPAQRSSAPELMDDPGSDRLQLEQTLGQFRLVNLLLSRIRSLLRRYVLRDMLARGVTHATVLDVGAGGCDVALWLLRAAERRGLSLSISCLDHDRRVLAYARRQVAEEPAIEVLDSSVFDIRGQWDYVICNHFLHHLNDQQVGRFLDLSYQICGRRLLANDLLRSHWSLFGFRVFAALLLHNSFARSDGVLSIKRGFRPHELQRMVERSAWTNSPQSHTDTTARVLRLAPGRVVIVASRG
ncbi:MAG: methyltransferase domain-containing protein [Spirochaetaceae bacterium]|nr:MAG: methyltransferase domain-containing protein [Spirochaetaceae bacterium]